MSPMMQPLRRVSACCLAVVLVACTSESPTAAPVSVGATPRPTPVATSSPTITAGETSSPAPTGTPTLPPITADPPGIALAQIASGFSSPIGIALAPGGWLLINERRGRVVALNPDDGRTAEVLDISGRVLDGGQFGEQGLLGLVLHPDWPATPRAFINYTDRDGNTAISEFTGSQADGEAPTLDPGSERRLLSLDDPFANHNGGQLAFGPDGYLYMAMGDGGSGGDPLGNGQNPMTLFGTIMRIDVAGGDPYDIPASNPFADGEGGAPEVFLIGLRNPWRFSFDAPTGLLWIGDVGQNAYEEINRVDPATDAGANLGWNLLEGNHCFAVSPCSADGLMLPVAEYSHDFGCSVTGGFVYRGEAIPDLRGWYVFSDYCSGTIFAVRSDATGVNTPRTLLETDARVSSFGQDANGELYLSDLAAGVIYRVVGGD